MQGITGIECLGVPEARVPGDVQPQGEQNERACERNAQQPALGNGFGRMTYGGRRQRSAL